MSAWGADMDVIHGPCSQHATSQLSRSCLTARPFMMHHLDRDHYTRNEWDSCYLKRLIRAMS